MAVPVAVLTKGAVSTSLLGGGITGSTLYGISHKNYSDFVYKFEVIVTPEVKVLSPLAEKIKEEKSSVIKAEEKRDFIIGTIKCDYWTDTNKHSHLTQEERLLECVRDRNYQLKENIRRGREQLEAFRQLTEKSSFEQIGDSIFGFVKRIINK